MILYYIWCWRDVQRAEIEVQHAAVQCAAVEARRRFLNAIGQ